MKHKLKIKKRIVLSFFLLPILALTVFALLQPQKIQQFAAQSFDAPPLFGCLQVGEGNPETCGTRLGNQLKQELILHGRPLNDQAVYYGDRLYGSLEYVNVGDLPIEIQNLTLYAHSGRDDKRVTFLPGSGQMTLLPGQTTKVENASYRFNDDDPRGVWGIRGVLIDNAGQEVDVSDQQTNIVVSAICTALRIKELTDKDKANLQTLCSNNPDNKLCSSRQYCEIFKGEGCTQPNVSKETDRWQCDEYVYLPKPEQDLLEELCKVYPDTDACKDFCARTIGSSLCPEKYLFIDTYTGKPIERIKHPRALFVREADGLQFKYSKYYPTDKTRIHENMELEGSASARIMPKSTKYDTDQAVAGTQSKKTFLAALPVGCAPDRPHLCKRGLKSPSVLPRPPGPVAPKKRTFTKRQKGCAPDRPHLCGNALPPPPPPPPVRSNCFPSMVTAKICRAEQCSANDSRCEARNQKLLTYRCNAHQCDPRAGYCPKQFVPAGGGCRAAPPAKPARVGYCSPDKPHLCKPVIPPQCGIPGAPSCNLERNTLPPDPAKGRIADPRTCGNNGEPIPPATTCTSLTVPETAVDGDLGYAKHCRSNRRDVNSIDDPSGVPQYSCCANSISLREGCCGQDCGVWTQKGGSDDRLVYRDGAGRVCSNKAAVEKLNICSGVDKDGVNRNRDNTIPPDLRGDGGGPQPDQPAQPRADVPPASSPPGHGDICDSSGTPPGCSEGSCTLSEDDQWRCLYDGCPVGSKRDPSLDSNNCYAFESSCKSADDCPVRFTCKSSLKNANTAVILNQCVALSPDQCDLHSPCPRNDQVCNNFKCVPKN